MKHKRLSCWILFIFFLTFSQKCYARNLNNDGASYNGYNYNKFRIVATPNGYLPETTISGNDCGAGSFKGPQDLFVDRQKNIYVLDSGNNRIVILKPDFTLKKIIDKFSSEKGEEKLNNPLGMFVDDDGQIYVADGENGRVLVMNEEGIVQARFEKPVTDTLPANFVFKPKKVVKSHSGIVYILAENVINGALEYDTDGNFIGYFGSNPIEFTFSLFWKIVQSKVLNRQQRMQLARVVPIEYANLDIDSKGFLYTCTDVTRTPFATGQLKKLNPLGKNLLKNISYDLAGSEYVDNQTTAQTNYKDIEIDEDGFINALDVGRGKVYQFDQESHLLFVFGTSSGAGGKQVGTFKMPVAIESVNGSILVLDAKKNNITIFKKTEFAEKVVEAIKLYRDGMNDEALGPWKEVLKANNNYELAYIGIGKALMNAGKYKEAMKYFKLGRAGSYYSDAFKEYRSQVLRDHFSFLMTLILLCILSSYIFVKRKRILKSLAGSRGEQQDEKA